MNRKQLATLAKIFADPVPANLRWADVEGLLKAAGCEVVEGEGSAVSFRKDGAVEYFHQPHPAKEAKRYQIRAARAFLARIGVTP
jgi:hypothetical protein